MQERNRGFGKTRELEGSAVLEIPVLGKFWVEY